MAFGVLLVLVGLASWPPGGLMFALPFVFLMPGAVLIAAGAMLVIMVRRGPGGAVI